MTTVFGLRPEASGGDTRTALIYATCVACAGRAALLRGPSGSGKSDLALRFLWLPLESCGLVADDQVHVEREDGALYASAPAAIAGLIEVRGIGLRPVPALPRTRLRLVVDLVPDSDVPRLPPEPLPEVEILGIGLPHLRLPAFEASAPMKLALALQA